MRKGKKAGDSSIMQWKSEAEKYKMKMEDRSEMMLDLTSIKRAINNYCKVLSSIAK